jgi:hypothetical protein
LEAAHERKRIKDPRRAAGQAALRFKKKWSPTRASDCGSPPSNLTKFYKISSLRMTILAMGWTYRLISCALQDGRSNFPFGIAGAPFNCHVGVMVR